MIEQENLSRGFQRKWNVVTILIAAAVLSACGSGGGGSSSSSTIPPIAVSTSTPTSTPTPTPTPTLSPVLLNGKIVAIPSGAYGPNATQFVLAGAIVVVGPTLVLGATPPPTLPVGDAQATTDISGNYSVSMSSAPVAPDSSPDAAFAVPGLNLSGFAPPTSGYYISVFAVGADGKSANAPLPVHAFSAVTNGTLATQRVTNATVDEAADLAYLNASRVKANPAAPILIFDEIAEETAREHAQDMAANGILCHYDMNNVGPESRYLRMKGLGGDWENAGFAGTQTPQAAFAFLNDWSISEGPGGGHYENIIATAHLWGGVATAGNATIGIYGDDELVSPHSGALTGYPNTSCSAGIVSNQS